MLTVLGGHLENGADDHDDTPHDDGHTTTEPIRHEGYKRQRRDRAEGV